MACRSMREAERRLATIAGRAVPLRRSEVVPCTIGVRMHSFRSAFCAALLLSTAAVQAQVVAGSFSPNPAPIGVPVTFTGTEAAGQGVQLPSPCGWYRIHQGSQT